MLVTQDDDLPFIAYNDLSWDDGQRSVNITRYTTDSGSGAPPDGDQGHLIDYDTDAPLAAVLTVTGGAWNGSGHAGLGGSSLPGTEAFNLFDGKVDTVGVLNYSEQDLVLEFTGLSPNLRYRIVLFGNRDVSTYTDRVTEITLSGVATFQNESSTGTDFLGPGDPGVAIVNGYNSMSGHVARFTHIDPGQDGTVEITISDGGSARPPRFYLNAVLIEGAEPADLLPTRVSIMQSSDDAEEDLVSGIVNLTSSDLELILDRGATQLVGLRFNALPVPRGATIEEAYVQFSTDETSSDAALVVVRAEAHDQAPAFENTSGNLSARIRTTSAVFWNPDPWTRVGERDVEQQTPDLSVLIQEVVNRPGWAIGHPLVLLFGGSGSGTRIAESWDGDSAVPPVLHLFYRLNP